MSSIINAIQNLPALLSLRGATAEEIQEAECQLGMNFTEEYKEYLAEFGAILADGIELTGIAKSEYRNVVLVTKQEWEMNELVPHTMYVIENTGVDGIMIWQSNTGAIYQSAPNMAPKQIANSLHEYIVKRMD